MRVAFISVVLGLGGGFYIPGSAPREYPAGSKIPVEVGRLWSSKTQVPYSYYDLDVCHPVESPTSGRVISSSASPGGARDSYNIWTMISGEVYEDTAYSLSMGVAEECEVLCTKVLNSTTLTRYREFIDSEYQINLYADQLPAALRIYGNDYMKLLPSLKDWETDLAMEAESGNQGGILLVGGYPVGVKMAKKGEAGSPDADSDSEADYHYIFFNHLSILIKVHEADAGYYRVVGFEVTPRSIDYGNHFSMQDCLKAASNPSARGWLDLRSKKPGDQIYFTYDVNFKKSDVRWATRWDMYFNSIAGVPGKYSSPHWLSLINGVCLILLLSIIIGTILINILRRDILRYNQISGPFDLEDPNFDDSSFYDNGWKLLSGDVFRKPRFSKVYASTVGVGVQLLIIIAALLLLALIGLLSPAANRGSTVKATLILYCFMGGPAGFVSARFNKFLSNTNNAYAAMNARPGAEPELNPPNQPFLTTLMTCFEFTGAVFIGVSIVNMVLHLKHSASAVPYQYLFLLFMVWFLISLPMVFLGAFLGYRKKLIGVPTQTNLIPRMIPAGPWYIRSKIIYCIGGLLPFAAVFGELVTILKPIWHQKFFYFFGFLYFIFMIMIITCAETSIFMTYITLANENYRWWWRSFWSSGFTAVYFFVACVGYYYNGMDTIGTTATLIYFVYCAIASYAICIVTGTIGTLASFAFVRKIYSSVKID